MCKSFRKVITHYALWSSKMSAVCVYVYLPVKKIGILPLLTKLPVWQKTMGSKKRNTRNMLFIYFLLFFFFLAGESYNHFSFRELRWVNKNENLLDVKLFFALFCFLVKGTTVWSHLMVLFLRHTTYFIEFSYLWHMKD